MSDQDASRRVGISDVSVSTSSLSMLESMHANFASSSNLIADSFTKSEPPDSLLTTDALPSASRAPSPRPEFHDAMSVVQNASIEAPAPPPPSNKHGPVLNMTLLLTSGKRHSYKIDEKFLTTRNITIPKTTTEGKKDPYSISVYTLKELILREWREEWESRPSSPSGIRLIYFGRLLDDNSPLMNCRFNRESSNVVHMSIRPQAIADEDEGSKSKGLSRGRQNSEATAGCRCAIM